MLSVQATTVDAPVVGALLAEYVAFRTAAFPGRYTVPSPDPAAFAPPHGVFVLATDDDEPLGCGGVRALDGAPGTFEVKHVYVRPEARGRGVGHLLLDRLHDEARALGATALVLDTHHTLAAAARLYARAGYVPVEPYNDNPNATVWYRKALD